MGVWQGVVDAAGRLSCAVAHCAALAADAAVSVAEWSVVTGAAAV